MTNDVLDERLTCEADLPREHFSDVTPRTIHRWRRQRPELWKPDAMINGRRYYYQSTIRRIKAAMAVPA